MSILILTNLFVGIQTPIQYQQNILWVSGYLQAIRKWVVGHIRSTTEFVGHKTQYMAYKNVCGTRATHNDRTRPAAGPLDHGVGVAA